MSGVFVRKYDCVFYFVAKTQYHISCFCIVSCKQRHPIIAICNIVTNIIIL